MARIGRPPLDHPRDKAVLIRLTQAEHEALKAGAHQAGKPLGAWLRELGLAATQDAAETPSSSTGMRAGQ